MFSKLKATAETALKIKVIDCVINVSTSFLNIVCCKECKIVPNKLRSCFKINLYITMYVLYESHTSDALIMPMIFTTNEIFYQFTGAMLLHGY